MRIRLQGSGHAAALLTELNRCRLSRLYCDVFLQVGNRSFSGHRAVLACAGSHFRTLFSRAQTSAYSLDFVSPANFEKVLTFIYTGEILIDLIDVGVLYELADRLGVSELVRACHAAFPDLRGSMSADCKSNGPADLGLDSDMVAAAAAAAVASTGVSASSVCSSAASCSSLSSSAGPSATPTPAAAPSPLLRARTPRPNREALAAPLALELKAEDIQSHLGYGQMTADNQLAGEHGLLTNSHLGQPDRVLPPGPVLQLKTEEVEGEKEAGGRGSCGVGNGQTEVCGDTSGSLPQSSNALPSDPCSFPDSSACGPASSSSSGDPLGSLRVGAVEGGVVEVAGDGRLVFGEVEVEEGDGDQERDLPLQGDGGGMEEGTEEEQWRQLAGEIIELSDDENYMEEEEEEDDEDDLVCVENGGGGSAGSQAPGATASCKACGVSFPADPASVRTHAETHLTETGLCRVCGASFPDRAAAVPHAVAHTGVPLFTCDMCRLQFCSQNKLLRHRRQTSSCYTLPPGMLTGAAQTPDAQCAVCSKTFGKDLQAVRDHLLTHVCTQSLSCGVCHLPQLSLCSLLWHALTHLSLPVYSCPHCAQSFLERPLLDRHMATHGEEAVALERVRSSLASSRGGGDGAGGGGGGGGGMEELRCFLCPQTFRSTSAFQYHLSLHTTDSLSGAGAGGGPVWSGKRKSDQAFDYPPSSCSSSSSGQREAGGLVKLSSLGFGLGMGFNMSDKMLPGAPSGFPSGFLSNGSGGGGGGLDRAAAEAAGVRGKWYRCRYCGKRFAHSGEFTYHLRIHTGEKPYQCKVCLRFFRGRSTMICHLKTHAGALMYRCTVCGLYFSTLKLVSSHMEVHKDHLPPDFNIEQTFMYNDHSKEPLPVSLDP